MFWLKLLASVATNTAGNVPTSSQNRKLPSQVVSSGFIVGTTTNNTVQNVSLFIYLVDCAAAQSPGYDVSINISADHRYVQVFTVFVEGGASC